MTRRGLGAGTGVDPFAQGVEVGRVDVALDELADQILLVRAHGGGGVVEPAGLLGGQAHEEGGTIRRHI